MTRKIRIKQRDATDCGAACLCAIAAHFNILLPLSRIRQMAGTDRHGTSLHGLLNAAEKMGLQAKAGKGAACNLTAIPLPAIAHTRNAGGNQHFVVITAAYKNSLRFMDPADGRIHRCTVEKFAASWSGIVVLFAPGASMMPVNQVVPAWQRFWELLYPHRSIMVQALCGAAVYTLLGLSTSLYLQKIVDGVLPSGNTGLLNLMSVIMIVLLLAQLYIGAYKNWLGLVSGQQIDASLVMRYYRRLVSLPHSFFDTMRVGELISRINDAVKIREFINETVMGIAISLLTLIFCLLLMCCYHWHLALLALLALPFYAVLYHISNRLHRTWQRTLMENSAALETQLVESLSAAGTVKRLRLEEHVIHHTENKLLQLLGSAYKTQLYQVRIGTSAELVTRITTILLLWAGSYFVVQNEISPGELLSFYALSAYFTAPVNALLSANRKIQEALIAADRLFEIIELDQESQPESLITIPQTRTGADIHFREVSFRYGMQLPVLNQFSAIFRKGTTTAVVGDSGSGKSTLLSLLLNLYPLEKGCILYGDMDIRYISLESLRRRIAIVPQHTDLFAGSIIHNISIGDDEPDMEHILHLCGKLGIHEFIAALPGGYHTPLAEQGVTLSGGQRQRIAVARALYRNPDVLLLDEATSSLDVQSEKMVQDAVRELAASGKTVIIIAHRLTAVKDCDHIMVLTKGVLAEQGTHDYLLTRKGEYYRLWQHHTGSVKLPDEPSG